MKNKLPSFSQLSIAATTFLFSASPALAQITNPVVPELADESAAAEAASGALFGYYLSQILQLIILLAGLMLLVMLLWGGIQWISSGGDKGKLETARNRMLHAILGMIVLAAGIAIFSLIQTFLGFEILTFTSSGS